MQLGAFQLDVLSDGKFWLDGGAMFGVVPKILWEKVVGSDEKNRIPLGLNCLLVRTGSQNILIDTGCGRKYSEKQFRIYGIDQTTCLIDELEKLEIDPAQIDLVINTHLHFDHCGGNTRKEDGRIVPNFPNATYLVSRQEYEDANNANERTQASYFPDNWLPLAKSGQLRLVIGNEEAAEGVTIVHTPGHTLGHQSVKITSEGRSLFYFGDLCPTSAHVPLPWIMSYDLFPLRTLETRKQIYRRAIDESWLLFFEHDPDQVVGVLREQEGKFTLEPTGWKL
jgi:glyoxylase-like metal-dependent hydrolase (beta-lactamase superfamily II)